MFRLIVTVKRGVPPDLAAARTEYSTLAEARTAALSLTHEERVAHVLIARAGVPPHFVEWAA
jgi:hypothetical protein